MKDLNEIRKDINRIDTELLKLFCDRMDCSKAVAEYKKENGIPIFNEQRENEILDKVFEEGGEYGEYARELYKEIMRLSRELQHRALDV